jgi:hypothetical protein
MCLRILQTFRTSFQVSKTSREGAVDSATAAASSSAASSRNTDATKEFRKDLLSSTGGLFDHLRNDLDRMELRIRAANISTLEKVRLFLPLCCLTLRSRIWARKTRPTAHKHLKFSKLIG